MATITIPNMITEKVYCGLNSYQYTIATSAVHNCRMEVDHHSTSTLTMSIVQAGSASATLATMTLPGGPAGGPQSTAILNVPVLAVAADTITFVVTSSGAIDNDANNVKIRVLVRIGGLN